MPNTKLSNSLDKIPLHTILRTTRIQLRTHTCRKHISRDKLIPRSELVLRAPTSVIMHVSRVNQLRARNFEIIYHIFAYIPTRVHFYLMLYFALHVCEGLVLWERTHQSWLDYAICKCWPRVINALVLHAIIIHCWLVCVFLKIAMF